MFDAPESFSGYGPVRNYGRMYGSLDFDDVSALNVERVPSSRLDDSLDG